MKEMKEMEKMGKIKKLAVLKRSAVFFLVTFLSGCVGMSSKFDCNVGSGGKCAPMHHINKMAGQGVFNESYGINKENALIRAESKSYGINKQNGYPLKTFDGAPIRSNESIQQIWIGPYEDTSGTYHEPAYVYVVVKKGRWIGAPASVIQE
jgi:conjugal transfer pilus assembly protein TraV